MNASILKADFDCRKERAISPPSGPTPSLLCIPPSWACIATAPVFLVQHLRVSLSPQLQALGLSDDDFVANCTARDLRVQKPENGVGIALFIGKALTMDALDEHLALVEFARRQDRHGFSDIVFKRHGVGVIGLEVARQPGANIGWHKFDSLDARVLKLLAQ